MSRPEVFIHPSATVSPKAQLDSGVWVGPFCVVGERVTIHKNTRLLANVFVDGRTEIGSDCVFSPFSAIGTEPQDVGYKEEETLVKIGDRNKFREFLTVHRATLKGGGLTSIGSDNYFMSYSHIAHDCLIGNNVILTNNATLGGHCIIEDFAYLSGFVGMHQFCRIGKYAFIGGFTVITQDVVPFAKIAGMRPVLFYGINAIGLRRRGFSADRIRAVKEIFKLLFYSNLNTTQAVEKIKAEIPASADRDDLLAFIQSSKRGIIKKASESWEDESA
jgi:UDP-N-acetylglucosamine acyltransferase